MSVAAKSVTGIVKKFRAKIVYINGYRPQLLILCTFAVHTLVNRLRSIFSFSKKEKQKHFSYGLSIYIDSHEISFPLES